MADLKFGRNPTPPEVKAVMPQLANYHTLKPAPASFNVSGLGGNYPMDLNDQLGDCLCAGSAHMEQVFSALTFGTPFVPSDSDVLTMYEALGYVPGDPSTDNGGTIPQALEVWRRQGIGRRNIEGWAEIDVTKLAEVMAACAEFQGLYAGLNCPQSAVDQFNAGENWDVVPNDGGIAGGHLTPILGYDNNGVILVTWARVIRASWAFWQAYYDEAAVVIPLDFRQLGTKTIDGDTEAQLIQDIDSIGGNVPVGPPGPTPSPTPTPTPPPAPNPEPWYEWIEDVWEWLQEHF